MEKSFVSVKSTIHPANNIDKPEIIGKYEFKNKDKTEFTMEQGVIYILTKWNSTIYIKALDEHKFEILDRYGVEEIETDIEYLVIKPKS